MVCAANLLFQENTFFPLYSMTYWHLCPNIVVAVVEQVVGVQVPDDH